MVRGGVDHVPHMGPALTDGWRGLRRSLPQSFIDLETSAPGAASGLWLGHQLKPILAPLTLRAEPLSPKARAAVSLGLLGAVGLAGYVWARRRQGQG